MKLPTIMLMLVTLLWCILIGGIVYSHMVYFPAFLADLPSSASVVTGPHGLNEAVFWMAIHPLLIITFVITLIANWRLRERRRLILMPFILYILILAITAVYFVPELMKFADSASSSIPASEWKVRSSRWLTLSIVRGACIFIAAFPLLIALTKPTNTNVAQ